jgi:two-component system, OmpR family, sensor kinase
MEQTLNYNKKNFIGKKFIDTPFAVDFKEKIANLIIRAESTKFLMGELDYPHESGELIPFGYHIKKIKEDINFTGTLIVLRNLRETKELLELKRIDKLKDEFVSMVSHELRTPLTSIKAYAETLLDMAEEDSVEQNFLSIINEESDRLNRLINDILDLSKIEAGKMEFIYEKNDINEVVEKAVKNMKSYAETKNIKIEHLLDYKMEKILFDKDRILQVLLNLINNAIKFSFDGDTLVLRTSETDKDYISIEVEDHGTGIDKENAEVIFEKFKQIQNVLTRDVGGTGLGLPICKRIIEEHYGKIWVESEKNKKTIFKILLPIVK